jgi:hypothetical protein
MVKNVWGGKDLAAHGGKYLLEWSRMYGAGMNQSYGGERNLIVWGCV